MLTIKKQSIAVLALVLTSGIINAVKLQSQSVMIPSNTRVVSIHQTPKGGFRVKTADQTVRIKRHMLDKELRSLNREDLARRLTAKSYVSVHMNDNNEYALKLNDRLEGGGWWLAQCAAVAGKFAVQIGARVVYGVAATGVVAVTRSPGMWMHTYRALETTFAVPVNVLSNTVAVGAGIGVGVITTTLPVPTP